MPDRPAGSATDYLAAERTFLAWIRTGLALMGFGFVVARFGLFLQALQTGQPALLPHTVGLSPWFGTALILLGVGVNVWCTFSYVDLVHKLQQGESPFNRPSTLAISVAVALAAVGLAMAIYIFSVREAEPARPAQEKTMSPNTDNGIVTIASHLSVDQTVAKLEALLQAKGVKLFALVDHSGEAEKVGLHMPATKLLIFGNPKAGTPLMVASPSVAIDLPLKILVWEGGDGKVYISYNTAAYLEARHALPADLVPNIAVVEALARNAADRSI